MVGFVGSSKKFIANKLANQAVRLFGSIVTNLADQVDDHARNVASIFNLAWQNGDVHKIYGE